MIFITLLSAITVLSQFALSESTSNGLVARQAIDPSTLPPACQSPCVVINTMINCGNDLTCMCTDTIGSELQQCMTCLANDDPNVVNDAQTALSDWNGACGGNLSLGGTGSGSGGTTGGTTGAAGSKSTSNVAVATATGTTTSSGSAPNPFGKASSAVNLKVGGSMVACIVVTLGGAFMCL